MDLANTLVLQGQTKAADMNCQIRPPCGTGKSRQFPSPTIPSLAPARELVPQNGRLGAARPLAAFNASTSTHSRHPARNSSSSATDSRRSNPHGLWRSARRSPAPSRQRQTRRRKKWAWTCHHGHRHRSDDSMVLAVPEPPPPAVVAKILHSSALPWASFHSRPRCGMA